MKERPILFAGPMVRAILARTKTQTRRLMRPQPSRVITLPVVGRYFQKPCPYGVPGDRLWVRETHLLDPPIDGTWPSVGDTFASVDDIPDRYRTPEHVIYRASCEWSGEQQARWRWRPSIQMPRWASRLTLEVTDVRVQRLQDISEDDADAEGVHPCEGALTARLALAMLWDSINQKRAPWASNPWVWAVTFRRLA